MLKMIELENFLNRYESLWEKDKIISIIYMVNINKWYFIMFVDVFVNG
jgi:hypothetical protein